MIPLLLNSNILLVILTSISLLLPPPTSGAWTKIDPTLRRKIDSSPEGSTFDVFIHFIKDEAKMNDTLTYIENLKPPEGQEYQKSYELMQISKREVEDTQGQVIKVIKTFEKTNPKLNFRSYWMTNDMGLFQAPKALLNLLGDDMTPESKNITEIVDNYGLNLDPTDPSDTTIIEEGAAKPKPPGSEPMYPDPYEPIPEAWGIKAINVPAWWKKDCNGTGVIIGHIDSGADSRHPALKYNWVGKGPGWLDPGKEHVENTFPYESNQGRSHGTHTLGIMVGRGTQAGYYGVIRGRGTQEKMPDDQHFFGVGIAPGARWISCLGCRGDSCGYTDVADCGDFMACPDPQCRYRPDIVSNSYGCPQNETMPCFNKTYPFHQMVKKFRSVGIITVFAAGNQGRMGCSTVAEPDTVATLSVGNVDKYDVLAEGSSMGPPKWRYTNDDLNLGKIFKPELIAPGVKIFSTTFTGRKGQYIFDFQSGTSQAAPHVAGAIALLLSYNRDLTFEQIKGILFNATIKNKLPYDDLRLKSRRPDIPCGNIEDPIMPNHKFGHGRLWLPDPAVVMNAFEERRPIRQMPPPPDYSDLADNSTPPKVRAGGMVGVAMMAGIAFFRKRDI